MIYAKITLQQTSPNVHRCDCPILDEELKTVEWSDYHPQGYEFVVAHMSDRILQSPNVTELDQTTAMALASEYANLQPVNEDPE